MNTASQPEHTLFLGVELPDKGSEWILGNIDNNSVVVKESTSAAGNYNNDYDEPNKENTFQLLLAEGVYDKIEKYVPRPS